MPSSAWIAARCIWPPRCQNPAWPFSAPPIPRATVPTADRCAFCAARPPPPRISATRPITTCAPSRPPWSPRRWPRRCARREFSQAVCGCGGQAPRALRISSGGGVRLVFRAHPDIAGSGIAGFAIAARRWELAVLFAVVFLLVYLPAVELEEQHLRSLFPDYADYARRVPKFVPRLAGNSSQHFRWSLYIRNRAF